ncbi:chaperone protein Dnaj 49 [Phtheirospermum japonicum]|uniref:Chaperone protein Dnaj 49 n=1 Tax=Phtheirospermum japonicum TaxID=374723 RepID=A0A830CVE1_9LAMI|nr:chaperone protein Dnaj 49 [Phtheirospermum japonicum]
MDSNKGEALRCINIAKQAIVAGNKQRALKFLTIARRLNHDLRGFANTPLEAYKAPPRLSIRKPNLARRHPLRPIAPALVNKLILNSLQVSDIEMYNLKNLDAELEHGRGAVDMVVAGRGPSKPRLRPTVRRGKRWRSMNSLIQNLKIIGAAILEIKAMMFV